MKKIFLLIILTQISLNSYSQINFERGYFYDNENNKTVCLIKNIDWLNNPTEIKYKLSENSEIKTATIGSINEFGVSDLVFKRFDVQIDRSSQQIKKLSYKRNPEFKNETLFLKQIVKGDSNLFIYVDGNFTTYFFNSNNKNITQLVYKKYLKTENIIAENNMFRQQLLNNLQCRSISYKDVKNLIYSKNKLSELFIKYNSCKGIYQENEEKIDKKDLFNIYIRAGVNINSFKIPSRGFTNPSSYEFDFGTILGFQFGVEAEFIFPFNKNKWSVIVEPTYNHFKSESTSLNYLPETVTFSYNTFELPIGIRHYFFLNDTSKLFINASYVLIFDLNSEFTSARPGFEFSKGTNMSFGLGYNYNNKYSIEARYDTDRGDLFQLSTFSTEFKTISIILGINVL